MDKKKYMTEEEFNNTPIVKEIFGDYANYTSYSTPTKSDNVYDNYMKEALNIYNQGVQENKDMAKSQSANALAQYNELNRNINELNKASGKANTGYAGDMSIDAYNAYRNSVNESYANAEKSNNDLYSYYLNGMMELQRAKDEHQAFQDERETWVVDELSSIISSGENYTDGSIGEKTGEQVMNYVNQIYGDWENVPQGVKAYLGTIKGFNEWNEDASKYSSSRAGVIKSWSTKNDYINLIGGKEGTTVGDDIGDNFRWKNADTEYKLETAELDVSGQDLKNIDKKLGDDEGSIVKYNGQYYVRTMSGNILRVTDRNGRVPDID